MMDDRIIKMRRAAIAARLSAISKIAQSADFKQLFFSLPSQKREELVYQTAIKMGKPNLVRVTLPKDEKTGIETSYEVMPNYFSIDGIVIPMTPATAEKIGQHFNLSLPTAKMSKQIWKASDIKMTPQPQPINQQSWADSVKKFNESYQGQLANKKTSPNQILGGGLKDLVVPEGTTDVVYATGWYNPQTGEPLQKFVKTMHPANYTDYSHGTRFVGNFIFKKDGQTYGPLSMREVMTNPNYKEFASVISDNPEKYSSYIKKDKPQVSDQNQEKDLSKYQELLNELQKDFS